MLKKNISTPLTKGFFDLTRSLLSIPLEFVSFLHWPLRHPIPLEHPITLLGVGMHILWNHFMTMK